MINKFTTHSADETIALGEEIGSRLVGGDIIAYRGGLGAGKTTITHGIAKGMGLKDDVSSPTFALVNEYRGNTNLYHFDMYRIVDEDDLYSTGFYDYLTGRGICIAEWCENIPFALPDRYITVKIEKTSVDTTPDERIVNIALVG